MLNNIAQIMNAYENSSDKIISIRDDLVPDEDFLFVWACGNGYPELVKLLLVLGRKHDK